MTSPRSIACLAAAAVSTVLAALSARAEGLPGTLAQRMTSAVEREHAAGRFDGVVLVGQGDGVVYQHAVGLAEREKRQPHRVDQAWRLASVSKQVAALLAMQQVEQGRMSLDSRLDSLLPAFKSPLAAQVTLRQLLQHTSGLPNPDDTVPDGALAGTMPAFYTRTFTDTEGPVNAALAFCAGPPAGEPGARFSYNNCDTLLVQAVLERLSGQPYAVLLQRAMAAPLGLTSFGMADGDRERAAPTGYLDNAAPEPAFNLASFGASGALLGSAEDLWRFDRALMRHTLLGEAATRVMWTGEPRLGYVALGAWSFPARLPGCRQAVALVERRGEIGGVQVRNLLAPELGAALIAFSNTAGTDFGEIWQGRGLLHEMAGAAFCEQAGSAAGQ